MHGVRLRVAYDGTDFVGWQRQPGQRSVQGELERAASVLSGLDVFVRGASRTDSGVHAEGQVVAFDSPRSIDPYGWVRGLNGQLPRDVAVQDADACDVGYDPRFDATGKTYRYLLHIGTAPDPLLRHRAWHLGAKRARDYRGTRSTLDDWLATEEMDAAAQALIGQHDFRAFRSARDERDETVRTMRDVRVDRPFQGRDDLVALIVVGDAFLHHMVRIMAGTLVDVGRERLDLAAIEALLGPEADRSGGGETAPAHGLTLLEVHMGRGPVRGVESSETDG